MIIINYWTTVYFEDQVWDKIYCKNIHSAKRYLKKRFENQENFLDKEIKDFLWPIDIWKFNAKTCSWGANHPLPNLKCWDLYISLREEKLL